MNVHAFPPDASALEHIEHVRQKVCMMWATPQLDAYLNRVLLDSREGERHGFPPDVCSELIFLEDLNKWVRAIDLAGKLGLSVDDAYQKTDQHDRGYTVFDLQHGIPHVDNV